MLKISKNHSVVLSIGLTVVFMLALIVGAFIVPAAAERFVAMRYPAGGVSMAPLLAISYGIIIICALADVFLFFLLRRVRAGLVFTPQSVSLVRAVSWCGVLMGVLFGLLGFYFKIAFAVAFAGIFLGLCVRVVKNVIEEATEIKSEHDLTV